MEFRENTPLSVVLEMYAVSFCAPVTVLVIMFVILALLHRARSRIHWLWRSAIGLAVIGLALLLAWFGVGLGTLYLLGAPRYRAYIECEPCF